MEQYAIVFQVLGVLLILFFGFITYMNTKTWKWVHVTFLFLTFVAAPTFGVYAAMTIKTRKAWMTKVQTLEADVKKLENNVAVLQRGEPNDYKNVKDSIYARTEELSRLILDRGRVWRNCTPGGVQGGTVTLQMAAIAAPPPAVVPMPMPMPVPVVDPAAPVDPAAAAQPPPVVAPMPVAVDPLAPAAAGAHNISEKLILYAFQEVDSGQGYKSPQFYLGEFYVTAVTQGSVTLAPTLQLSPEQQQVVNAGNATWMLFETCPIDTHEIFAGLDAAAIGQFIPIADTGLSQEDYAALINTYVQDGQRAADNTPPDNLWAEVKFKKTHKEEVDLATPNDAADLIPFDNTGLAQPKRLQRKETDITEFEPGDTAVLPKEKADELVAAGIAEMIQPIYRRKIIDYAARFRSIHRRTLEINLNKAEITRDIATLKAGIAKAEEQITLETEHKRQLDGDLSKVTFERDGVARYGSSLFGKLTQVNADIRNLYSSNRALNIELQQLTAKATEEADRRTREATAANKP